MRAIIEWAIVFAIFVLPIPVLIFKLYKRDKASSEEFYPHQPIDRKAKAVRTEVQANELNL